MRKYVLMFCCAVVISSVFLGNASAEGEHMHDGFFLRLAPGIGYSTAKEEFFGDKLEISGMSGLFNFAIGGAISENLILHLDLSGVSASDPTFKYNGVEQVVTSDVKSSTSLIGVGLTYYFPSNLYLTGAVGIAESKLTIDGTEYKTDKGFGVNVLLGREWWVSDNWGLGIAGQFLYTNCPDKPTLGITPDVKTTSFGVLFSATYN